MNVVCTNKKPGTFTMGFQYFIPYLDNEICYLRNFRFFPISLNRLSNGMNI